MALACGLHNSMLQTEFIPAQKRDSKWLLIALHGLGDSMDGYRWVPRLMNIPELNYHLVNAPDAYYGGFSWYDFAADPAPGVKRSYKLLEGLLDEQRAKGFPTEQTFLFGFSQGCLMTIETGLRYPHKLAGLIGVSGYVFEPETLVTQMSPVAKEQELLITHGTSDALIPISQVRSQMDLLKGGGVRIEWHEYPKDHTVIEPEISLFRTYLQKQITRGTLPSGAV